MSNSELSSRRNPKTQAASSDEGSITRHAVVSRPEEDSVMIPRVRLFLLIVWLACSQAFPESSAKKHESPTQTEQEQSPLLEMKFIKIQAGNFVMGSAAGEKNESPVHLVTIDHEFELQETEVTQTQWESVMGNSPRHYRSPHRPVESVSWDDVQKFISKLDNNPDGYRYRLPTEAEWEYACRGGTKEDYAGDLDEMGFYDKNSGLTTQPVRSKRPNAWGLYDMHGNVWEWVQDWYGKYKPKQLSNPQGPPHGSLRVIRGGGWHSTADGCRSAFRLGAPPGFRNSALGFRLVRLRSRPLDSIRSSRITLLLPAAAMVCSHSVTGPGSTPGRLFWYR